MERFQQGFFDELSWRNPFRINGLLALAIFPLRPVPLVLIWSWKNYSQYEDSMNALRRARFFSDVTLQSLSKKSGVSVSRLSNYERGFAGLSAREKKKIARILKSPVEDLFREDGSAKGECRSCGSSLEPVAFLASSRKG
jgi:hypothetical protein